MGWHRSTIGRELTCNGVRGSYSATTAQARAGQQRARSKTPKLAAAPVLAAHVTARLDAKDSPMTISIEPARAVRLPPWWNHLGGIERTVPDPARCSVPAVPVTPTVYPQHVARWNQVRTDTDYFEVPVGPGGGLEAQVGAVARLLDRLGQGDTAYEVSIRSNGPWRWDLLCRIHRDLGTWVEFGPSRSESELEIPEWIAAQLHATGFGPSWSEPDRNVAWTAGPDLDTYEVAQMLLLPPVLLGLDESSVIELAVRRSEPAGRVTVIWDEDGEVVEVIEDGQI